MPHPTKSEEAYVVLLKAQIFALLTLYIVWNGDDWWF